MIPLVFALSLLLSRAESHAVRTQECRVLPGDNGWPSQTDWDQLNSTVGGRLIASVPLGSPCHDPNYDEDQCNYLRKKWGLPLTFEDNPVTPMSYWFQNATCDPWTDRTTPCELGNMAQYAVNVTGPDDVAAAVDFARERGIRLSIKNTGHDFNGKSVGQGSLAIWTRYLNDFQVNLNYSQPWYQGAAVKMGSGIRGGEAYKAAYEAGLRVVGGNCPTVGIAGGYIQGGGHSPLSGMYGMAADNVLEWDVVLANGSFVTATPETNSDLYFALAGSGPSTFGVVTAVTVRAFPDGPVGGASLIIDRFNLDNDTFWEAYGLFRNIIPTMNAARATSVYEVLPAQFYLWSVTRPGYDEAQMRQLLSNFTTGLDNLGVTYDLTVTVDDTYYDHMARYYGPAPWGSFPIGHLISGRLIPVSVSDATPESIVDTFREIADNTQIAIASTSQDVSFQSDRMPVASNSVLPGWRDSAETILFQIYFNSSIPWPEKEEQQKELIYSGEAKLDAIVPPGTGAYLNEASFSTYVDWKTQFYGSNYDRLLAIKNKYDPGNVFWAVTAVGSDVMTLTGDGHLCLV